MDLNLLSKQTSPVMVREIERLSEQFNEPITHLKVDTHDEWVSVYFVLADTGFEYQFNKKTGEYSESFMALHAMKYFRKAGLLD
ncbi:hypothetical protein P4H46_09725 [Paenibacillus glucanolyticus]|uniref:hypothetical protein n=1 Tax=Paenibacillus TaxID=44249 RepID=UPI001C7D7AAF|nr:hypothetical protein [Paenibacillus lautus]MBX4152314.1 hypothetical protein [Paenibacillus lautus]HCY5602914.1 hypothetical protein [Staphylococcus aureus]